MQIGLYVFHFVSLSYSNPIRSANISQPSAICRSISTTCIQMTSCCYASCKTNPGATKPLCNIHSKIKHEDWNCVCGTSISSSTREAIRIAVAVITVFIVASTILFVLLTEEIMHYLSKRKPIDQLAIYILPKTSVTN